MTTVVQIEGRRLGGGHRLDLGRPLNSVVGWIKVQGNNILRHVADAVPQRLTIGVADARGAGMDRFARGPRLADDYDTGYERRDTAAQQTIPGHMGTLKVECRGTIPNDFLIQPWLKDRPSAGQFPWQICARILPLITHIRQPLDMRNASVLSCYRYRER
jgi:hypothetical protein